MFGSFLFAFTLIYHSTFRMNQRILLRKSSHPCPAGIYSSFENRMLFPVLEKAIPPLHKKPSAKVKNYIGHEEKYLKCSFTRLKHNFGLSGTLKIT